MKQWWTSWFIILFLAIPPSIALSEPPAHPPPDTAISWDVHRSLGIIMTFRTDRGLIHFAHPVLVSQLASGCRGVTWDEQGDTITLLDTDTTGTPSKYIILKEPIAYRLESGKWESIVTGRYLQ